MQRFYPAVIGKDPDSDYGISFPDFPGCVSVGLTPDEAIVMGTEALAGHVALMVEDGDPIPDPSRFDTIPREEEGCNIHAIVMIPVIIPERSRRINITIDEGLIEEIDRVAPNRSRFLANAARSELARLVTSPDA